MYSDPNKEAYIFYDSLSLSRSLSLSLSRDKIIMHCCTCVALLCIGVLLVAIAGLPKSLRRIT